MVPEISTIDLASTKRDGKAQIDYLVQEGNVKVVWGGLGEGPG